MSYILGRDFRDGYHASVCHDSSSDGSSSKDDLDVLLLHLEKPKRILGPRLNLEDLTNLECEQLFRLVIAVRLYI